MSDEGQSRLGLRDIARLDASDGSQPLRAAVEPLGCVVRRRSGVDDGGHVVNEDEGGVVTE